MSSLYDSDVSITKLLSYSTMTSKNIWNNNVNPNENLINPIKKLFYNYIKTNIKILQFYIVRKVF